MVDANSEQGNLSQRVSLQKQMPEVTANLMADDWDQHYAELSPETQQKWESQKPERNALTAIIVNRSFRSTLSKASSRPPYGLLTSRESEPIRTTPYKPFTKHKISEIGRDVRNTLGEDLDSEIQEISKLPQDDINFRALQRLNAMVDQFWRGGKRNTLENSEFGHMEQFIMGGVNTAISTMEDTLTTIYNSYSRTFKSPPSESEFIAIAKKSYGIVARLAAGDLNRSLPLIEKIKAYIPYTTIDLYDGYMSNYFTFHTSNDASLSLVFDNDNISPLIDSLTTENSAIVTGCPALVPFPVENEDTDQGQKPHSNVVKDLWDWYIDRLAVEI